jgi:y4mF family transcriptional regulator
MSLSQYIKQMRKQYNLTQVELSEKSGVGLKFIRDLEQGKNSLLMDKVNQVLSLFGAELAPVSVDKNNKYAVKIRY